MSSFGTRSGPRLPTGSLVVTVGATGPHWEGKWRWNGRQHKRRLGHAWLQRSGDGWIKRPGRAPEGFLSREDAVVALRGLIAAYAAEEAENALPAMPSFEQVATAWYERAVRRGRKPATLAAYRWVITAHIRGERVFKASAIGKPCPFVDKPVDALTKDDLRGWFNAIPQSPQRHNLYKIVKSVLRFAVDEGWATDNPARHVESHAKPDDGSYECYDRQEIDRLIAAASSDYDACLYATAAFTGLRKGELFALQWSDVDFKRSRITVRRNYSHTVLTTPKNGRVRVVPLIPELAARLKLYKLRQKPAQTGPVFPGSPDAAMVRYRKAVKGAGLRHLAFHSLRHSFGSHAISVATVVQVKQWMGHADVRVTSRYLHAKALDSDSTLLARGFHA